MYRPRAIGDEKPMRRRIMAMLVVALVIITTQVPNVFAQDDNGPAPAASPAAPAQPTATNSPAPDAEAPPVGVATLPRDLSPWGMFLNAAPIVKAVMIGLAFASLVTWTVWIAKTLELRSARASIRKAVRLLGKCATLAKANGQLRDDNGPAAQPMLAAAIEFRFSTNPRADGLKERIAWQLERIEMAAGRKISRGT